MAWLTAACVWYHKAWRVWQQRTCCAQWPLRTACLRPPWAARHLLHMAAVMVNTRLQQLTCSDTGGATCTGLHEQDVEGIAAKSGKVGRSMTENNNLGGVRRACPTKVRPTMLHHASATTQRCMQPLAASSTWDYPGMRRIVAAFACGT